MKLRCEPGLPKSKAQVLSLPPSSEMGRDLKKLSWEIFREDHLC